MELSNLERLYPSSKIIQISPEGQLCVIPENLNAILDFWQQYKFLPSRFLAVTGGRKSGKTFLTNLIIHWYSCTDVGIDWLSSIGQQQNKNENQQGQVQGFFSELLKLTSITQSEDLKTRGGGAVYLWPKPFVVNAENQEYYSKNSLLWILQMETSPELAGSTQQFLLLVCSHLVEILNGETNMFQLFKNIEKLRKAEVSQTEICESVTYILRAPEESSIYSQFPNVNCDQRATQNYLENLLKISQPDNHHHHQNPDRFRKSSIVKFSHYLAPLHDSNGILLPEAIFALYPCLQNIFQNVATNVAQSSLKILGEDCSQNILNGENCLVFFTRVVEFINKLNSADIPKPETNYLEEYNQPLTQSNFSMERRKESFESSIFQTIDKSMTYFNIPTLFRTVFNETFGYGTFSLELIDNDRKQLEKLISIVDGYSSAILRYFSNNYVCFTTPKTLDTFCDREFKALLKAFEATDSSFLFEKVALKACERLRKMFHEDNEQIVAHEREMGILLVEEIRKFYHSEMGRFLGESGNILDYYLEQQEDNHQKLMKECISLFNECYNLNDKLNEVIPLKEEELRKSLSQAFFEHQELIKRKQTIAEIQQTYHAKYVATPGPSRQPQRRVAQKQKIQASKQIQLAPIQLTSYLQNNYFDRTLIFQLTMEQITIARIISNGTVEILGTEPLEIGITYRHEYVIGSDNIKRFGRSRLKIFSLHDLFKNLQSPSKTSSDYGITVEFLVGKILRKLKAKAEARLQIQFVGALFSFPVWMRTYFQTPIETAAKDYAKFINVQIMDERECIARSFLGNVEFSPDQKQGLLILSQNSGYVDIDVYLVDLEQNIKRLLRKVVPPEIGKNVISKAIGCIKSSTPPNLKISVEDVQKNYGHLIGAAVVSTGEKNVESLLHSIKHFAASYYFSDGKKAVIVGTVLEVISKVESIVGRSENVHYSGGSSESCEVYQDPGPSSERVLSQQMDVQGGSRGLVKSWENKSVMRLENEDHGALATQTSHSEQRVQNQAQPQCSEAIQTRKQALLALCLELKRNIESTQFQSALAKNVIIRKVESGYQLASDIGGNHTLSEIEKQINLLEKLGIQNNLRKN